MHNIFLVTTQSLNKGSLDIQTFAYASAAHGYHVYEDVSKQSIGEKLVAKLEFNNPMGKHTMINNRFQHV